MTGMAAIAFCAAFTSCSKGEDLYNEEQINQNTVEKIKANYAEAFVATFGQPAADQDWGFGSLPSGTRNHGADGCINVNGNMWTECPSVDDPAEVNAIYDYVKDGIEQMQRDNKPYSTEHPKNLYGYFVTQVRNGLNDEDNNYINTYNNNAPIEHVGQYMNNLQVAISADATLADLSGNPTEYGWTGSGKWEHINNFNGSLNANHSTDGSHGNTMVEKKGAYDFAYYNSLDHSFHRNWILVDGADIEPTGKYKNYYYVCFDFDCTPDNTAFTRVSYDWDVQTNINAELPGTYYTVDEIKDKLTEIGGHPMSEISNIRINSWSQQDKMLKGNNVYSDWIIRITKGEPEYDIRIIAEDLLATAEDDDVSSDWDFNDVVFDVKFLDPEEIVDGKNVKIRVVAAGGTYPLYVAGQEVHALLGQDTDVMINTNATHGKHVDNVPAQVFYVKDDNAKSTNGKSIEVTVDFGNGPIKIEAVQGHPAAKIGVSPSFVYCKEKSSIKKAYPKFVDWVQKKDPVLWWSASQTMR